MFTKSISRHLYNLSPSSNGGETLVLITHLYANGDPITPTSGFYIDQQLTLLSYGNSATFNLITACLTPSKLRELADQLEKQIDSMSQSR